jgi:glucosamine-6-phosphate deaminase
MLHTKYNKLDVREKLKMRFEKIFTTIFDDSTIASQWVALEIADLILEKAKRNELCILGLATGSSPIGVYRELVRMHRQEGLSFKNVVTFNLDEYYPIPKEHIQSYWYFMHDHLFNHIDIPKENINIPDGTISLDTVYDFCSHYEEKITHYGGIDIQILGIGRTGHIGFNEPGSDINSPTRLITLDHLTIADAASDFFAEENVPRKAITMGIAPIMNARKIILMAWGEKKAEVIREAVEGIVTDTLPSSFLQEHPNVEFVIDKAAAASLTREKTPWLVSTCKWNDALIRRAVVWLCQKINKPILKLTDRDYNDNGMSDLLANHGPAYSLNIKIFNQLQHTITGWPGGKPNADDSNRPERAKPFPKKVLVFSPHPDDDAISMGGTLFRLVEQGNEVHVVYQTNGNISVSDDDVIRYADFLHLYQEGFRDNTTESEKWFNQVSEYLASKKPGQIDNAEIQRIKVLIRQGEARAACRLIGIKKENIHFLDMPFYQTGTIRKNELSDMDIDLIISITRKIKPHQIFAAGDMSDPHGTHRICLSAIYQALDVFKTDDWFRDCIIWLYRGAWQEWDIAEAEMVVPISPEQLVMKRRAIFKHQSQKDKALFPGFDEREFWQRAEDRNKNTAILYNNLGLAEYEAMEVFVKMKV